MTGVALSIWLWFLGCSIIDSLTRKILSLSTFFLVLLYPQVYANFEAFLLRSNSLLNG